MTEIRKSESEFRRFAGYIRKSLNGQNIKTMSLKDMASEAISSSVETCFGSHSWRSAYSSRIAPKTVYLGSPKVSLPKPTQLQSELVKKAPEELEKVVHLLETLPFVHVRRQMGNNDSYNPICNLYVSIADRKNIRLAYMWANTMFKPSKRPGPEVTMIHIPEEHQLKQQVLAIPEANMNIALGTDYMGEDKKGFLRQAMWMADEADMLGLHAGTKMVTVRDPSTNKLKRFGVYIFGLTATGKSTWACHQLGLNEKIGEKTQVTQDDVVFLRSDGGSYGSENNFYVKTDVTPTLQEAMYNSLVHHSALMENVMVDAQGKPDFLDESLCGNGRAVISRKKLSVKRGWRMRKIFSKSVNLPPASEMDGVIFAFITRRNTIMPFAQKLSPEQAVLAYLWGESTHSYASQPAKAGESVRIVGTDPFIVGSRARKVNRFYDILMALYEKYPHKIHCYQYNTGGVGEIIETLKEKGSVKKKLIRKVNRVPIDLMAAIQLGDLKGTNYYEPGKLNTKRISRVKGMDLSPYDVDKLYSLDQIDNFIRELVQGRKAYTDEIASEGLNPEIIRIAERSFSIAPQKKKVFSFNKTETKSEKSLKLRKPDFDNVVPRTRIPKPHPMKWR